MKIEYLYAELGNLFGDAANFRYLRACLPEAEVVETPLGAEPAFLSDPDVRFVYAGAMSEQGQHLALQHLRPYAGQLAACVEGGTHFLFTGNSLELLGEGIETGDGFLEGLGLLDFRSRQDMAHRYNGLFYGEADGLRITAFNSRFSHSRPGPGLQGFAKVLRGIGLEEGCAFEGVQMCNLLGSYLVGPLLVLNPLLTQKLLKSLGAQNTTPPHFEAAMAAYEQRKKEFENPRVKLD